MPNKPRFPRLEVEITPDRWETATTASSGGCLISDAIKDQFPQYSGVLTDAQTIRFTDRAKGLRYTYLTPQSAQNLLLFFDQGWSEPAEHTVRLRTPIKVDKVTTGRDRTAHREKRKTELLAKQEAGEELTGREAQALTRIQATDSRPHGRGPITEVISRRGGPDGIATVVGGQPLPRPDAKRNPNLLAGRNRLFGAKTAQPALVFEEAVQVELARRLADAGGSDGGATQPATPPTSEG